jgi:secreted trypsin-like serine protease
VSVKIGALTEDAGLVFGVVNVRDFDGYRRGGVDDPINDLKIVEIDNTDRSLGERAVLINSDPSLPPEDGELHVSGYGRLSSGGDVAGHLRSVKVPIVPYTRCKLQYPDLSNTGNICAGNEKYDSCQGDSGSGLWGITPARAKNGSLPLITIYGVVSYGQGCASAQHPGVYTRLSTYNDWIQADLAAPPNTVQNQKSTGQGLKSSTWLLIGLIVTALVAIVLLLICGYCCWTRHSKNEAKG